MEITQLEPQAIWKNFSRLNEIPRPSKKEEQVIQFIELFGKQLNLEIHTDEVGNVLIRKPATVGMEDRQTVVMQSHLDMVCQKNNDTEFDFDTQGIQMYVDGDWVKAKGTTLGADNGLGVAAILSILESTDIAHPAIEALFTIDEETGMTGALGLKPNVLTGKILLNLDTEEDDEITIGCAGGIDVTGQKQYSTKEQEGTFIRVNVKGLQGGHSGMDIHRNLGNANVFLGRILNCGLEHQIQIAKIDSGGLRNAIPREGFAVFFVSNVDSFLQEAKEIKQSILNEFSITEKELSIEFNTQTTNEHVLSVKDSSELIFTIQALHNGVYRMSPAIENLVEASNNIARIELIDGSLSILNLTRSSVESTKHQLVNQLKSVMSLAKIDVSFSGNYPGWQPNPNAEIITTMSSIYERLFTEKPHINACHAGLECGIIGANYPELEMVSFGPCIRGAHSPDERAGISSTQKFWKFLLEVLANIPTK